MDDANLILHPGKMKECKDSGENPVHCGENPVHCGENPVHFTLGPDWIWPQFVFPFFFISLIFSTF